MEIRRFVATSILALGFAPIAAFAYSNTGSSTITGVSVDTVNNVIDVSGTWSNGEGCQTAAVIAIPMSGNYKDLEAAVFAAYVSGKAVSFWVNGCVYSGGDGDAPSAYSIVITG